MPGFVFHLRNARDDQQQDQFSALPTEVPLLCERLRQTDVPAVANPRISTRFFEGEPNSRERAVLHPAGHGSRNWLYSPTVARTLRRYQTALSAITTTISCAKRCMTNCMKIALWEGELLEDIEAHGHAVRDAARNFAELNPNA